MLVFGGVIVDHGQYQPFLKWKIFGTSQHFPIVGLEPKIHAKLGGPFLKKGRFENRPKRTTFLRGPTKMSPKN